MVYCFARVPTAAMRTGDFSDSVYLSKFLDGQIMALPAGNTDNELSRSITGGRIAANAIDPTGRIMMGLLPLPNLTAPDREGFNYVNALTLDQNMKQMLTRVDYNISESTKFYARYHLQTELQPFLIELCKVSKKALNIPFQGLFKNGLDLISSISLAWGAGA